MPEAGEERTRRSANRRMEADRRNWIGLDFLGRYEHTERGNAKDSVLFYVQIAPLLVLIYEPRKTNISKPMRPRTKEKQKGRPNNDVRR